MFVWGLKLEKILKTDETSAQHSTPLSVLPAVRFPFTPATWREIESGWKPLDDAESVYVKPDLNEIGKICSISCCSHLCSPWALLLLLPQGKRKKKFTIRHHKTATSPLEVTLKKSVLVNKMKVQKNVTCLLKNKQATKLLKCKFQSFPQLFYFICLYINFSCKQDKEAPCILLILIINVAKRKGRIYIKMTYF